MKSPAEINLIMLVYVIMKRKLIINLTVLFSTVLFILAVGEIGVRAFYVEPPASTHQLFMQYDELLGWKKIPNNRAMHVTDEFRTTILTNSKSMRGPEYPYVDESAALRMVVLGDSFTEGYTVEFNEVFSEVLRGRLDTATGGSVDVINLGTAGYSTDQELLLFQNEGKRYQQHLTLLMFYENDIWFNGQDKFTRGYKPLFGIDENELTLTNFPVPEPEDRHYEIHYMEKSVNGRPQPKAGPLRSVKRQLRAHSALYRFTVGRIKNSHLLHTWAVDLGLAEKVVAAPGDTRLRDEFRIWKTPYDADIHRAWEITKKLLGELNREVEAVGSRLLVFYIPNKASVYDEMWRATKRKYGLYDENWNIEQPRIELESFLERNGIGFLDLTPSFRREADVLGRDGKMLYFESDAHWNVYGHQLAGEVVADFIKKRILENSL